MAVEVWRHGVGAPAEPGPRRVPLALAELARGLVDSGRATAVAGIVASAGESLAAVAAGEALGPGEPLFDLASLTKPWTASLALRLDASGRLPLDLPVGEVWPEARAALARRSLEDLLRHRAGLTAWAPLYSLCHTPEAVAGYLLRRAPLDAEPDVYGDLGYVLWGLSAERVLGQPLVALLRDELIRPLGLHWVDDAAPPGRRWLATELDNRRELELAAEQGVRVALRGGPPPGVVQDGNARFLGGLAGHAGLFASPLATLRLAREWIAPSLLWPTSSTARALDGTGAYRLGWRRGSRTGSAGPALGAGAFGHVGFTGGSVWIEPDPGRIYVLLAHRPGVDVDLAPARRRFHALARALF